MVQRALGRGFAVAAGERFRLRSRPAIRITTAAPDPRDAEGVAAEVAAALAARGEGGAA